MNALAQGLQKLWWQRRRRWPVQLLRPLAALVQGLAGLDRWRQRRRPATLRAPVLVVGNLIVGGAGKTPTTIALVQALQARGWHPGVVSRGHGRHGQALHALDDNSRAEDVGDEPLLIQRRTRVPVVVARRRDEAAQALLAAHPEVDLVVADDGLQHWRLPRDWQLIVFDGRGAGNGLTLPAGPLRQPMPARLPPRSSLLYNAAIPSTPWPGHLAQRGLAGAVSLADWWRGVPASLPLLQDLAARSRTEPPLAVAGLAEPERFFTMLEAAGLQIRRLPLNDHAPLQPLPWPADAGELLLTEKDAVKLRPESLRGERVWVVALDFQLPETLVDEIDAALAAVRRPSPALPTP